MKKFTILSFLLFFSLCVYPQDYLIYFTGTGGSTSVDNVNVENLTQGTSLTLNGTDILNLRSVITGINDAFNTSKTGLKVYPNPATEYATIEFTATDPGEALIAVYDQLGKTIVQLKSSLVAGTHSFQIDGLNSGLYIMQVKSEKYSYAGKLLSEQKCTKEASIAYSSFFESRKSEAKSTSAIVQMQYNTGDRLMLTGISGTYSTVVTNIPTGDKTVTFDFIACTDGDNNNYPIVKIGAQTWMAENLKTTKYNDSNTIPNVTDGSWSALTTPAYCWYDNNESANKDAYGALYNWFTVNTDKLCPTGWQVPSDEDWSTLTTNLGGDSISGGKLKETGTQHWTVPNTTATNETGFSARAAGYRGSNGTFGSFGVCDFLWSSSEELSGDVIYRFLGNSISSVNRGPDVKTVGFSVRCIKEAEGTVTDVDGNVYHTVTIGTQTWMVENLKTTKYNDGTDIHYGTAAEWADLTTGAFCWYHDSMSVYKEPYGALYNWYAIDSASNGGKDICPAGWHVPTDADWTILTTYLGGEEGAAAKLKETGQAHWFLDNSESTNEYGFTALPGGARWDYEDFNFLEYAGYWWSAKSYDTSDAWYRYMDNYNDVYRNTRYKYCGLSIRCVKD